MYGCPKRDKEGGHTARSFWEQQLGRPGLLETPAFPFLFLSTRVRRRDALRTLPHQATPRP
jgi:hypothetical protein